MSFCHWEELAKDIKQMKILMLAPEEFYDETGTPLSVYYRIKTLSELGHRVDLVTYHLGKEVRIKNTGIYRIPKIPFIKKIKVGPSWPKVLLDIVLFFKAFSLLMRNSYDCLHAHEEASLFGIIFKKLFKLPHIYDMHSSLPQQLINYNFTKSRIIIYLMSFLERWTIKCSDHIIVICPHLKETVVKINPNKLTTLIENTSQVWDVPLPGEGKTTRLKEKLSLNDKKVIMYTGTFEANQGIGMLIESIPLVIEKEPEIKYVLVGGKPQHLKETRKMVSHLNLNDYVEIVGMRPIQEMESYLALSNILVSPRTIGTNTPLKIYSYLTSKKPIVATNLLTHTQVLSDEVAILVEPTKEGLANGVIRLLRDEALGKILARKAKELAQKKYSYENFKNRTKGVYDSIESLRMG